MNASAPAKGTVAAGLVDEIRRYLVAVDAFRAAGYEPCWLPEPPPARSELRSG